MNGIQKAIITIEQAIARFDSQIPELEARLLKELLLLVKNLKTDVRGNLAISTSNLRAVVDLRNKLAAVIKNPAYMREVRNFAAAFNRVADFQNIHFESIGAMGRKELLKAVQKNAMQSLSKGLTGAGLNQTLADDIIDDLKTAVLSGESYSELVQRLQTIKSTPDNAGLLSKFAKTYAHDAINDFMGQRNKIIGDDLGLEWYMYVGGNLETTREFCEHLTKKKYIHKSELPVILRGEIDGHQCEIYGKTGLPRGMVAGTNVHNFVIYRGGWNCGHQLVPVAAEAVPEDVRRRFESGAVGEPPDVFSAKAAGPVDISKQIIKEVDNETSARGLGNVLKNRGVASIASLSGIPFEEAKNAVTQLCILAEEYNVKNLKKVSSVNLKPSTMAQATGSSIELNKLSFNDAKKCFEDNVSSYSADIKLRISDKESKIAGLTRRIQTETNAAVKMNLQWQLDDDVKALPKLKSQEPFKRHNVILSEKTFARDVVTHEFGHVLHEKLTGALNGRIDPGIPPDLAKALNDEFNNLYAKHKDTCADWLSYYGTTKYQEFFAESFVLYKFEQTELPQDITDFFDRLFNSLKL